VHYWFKYSTFLSFGKGLFIIFSPFVYFSFVICLSILYWNCLPFALFTLKNMGVTLSVLCVCLQRHFTSNVRTTGGLQGGYMGLQGAKKKSKKSTTAVKKRDPPWQKNIGFRGRRACVRWGGARNLYVSEKKLYLCKKQ